MFSCRSSNIARLLVLATVILLVGINRLAFASASDLVKICVPNQSLPPFYFVQDNSLSGLTIEHLDTLFEQTALKSIGVEYIPRPWQRCLRDIENGNVDLLVAGYSQERARKAVYPDSMGLAIGESIFSTAQICLVKRRSENWTWTGKALDGRDSLVFGLEPGFLIQDAEIVKRVVSVWDASQKYELLKLGRVDAVLTVCGVKDEITIPDEDRIPDELEIVFPPFINSPVYLVFSAAFYLDFPEQTKLIIETSNEL